MEPDVIVNKVDPTWVAGEHSDTLLSILGVSFGMIAVGFIFCFVHLEGTGFLLSIFGFILLFLRLFGSTTLYFSPEGIWRRNRFLTFMPVRQLLDFSNVDCYYNIYAAYVETKKNDENLVEHDEFWLVKDGDVVFRLPSFAYDNINELLEVVPVAYKGEIVVEQEDYLRHRLPQNVIDSNE